MSRKCRLVLNLRSAVVACAGPPLCHTRSHHRLLWQWRLSLDSWRMVRKPRPHMFLNSRLNIDQKYPILVCSGVRRGPPPASQLPTHIRHGPHSLGKAALTSRAAAGLYPPERPHLQWGRIPPGRNRRRRPAFRTMHLSVVVF